MSTKKSILLLLGISLAVYCKWLLPGIYSNSDWWFVPPTLLSRFFSLPSSWSILAIFGGVDLTLWRYPLDFLYGVTGILGFTSTLGDRVFDFWPTIIFGNLAMFFLAKKVTKSNTASFFASIFFNYNTYFFTAFANFLLYSASVWSVITLLMFILLLEKKRILFSLLTGVALFITGIYDFRFAYLTVFLLSGYFFYCVLPISTIKRRELMKIISYSMLSFLLFAILNLYWVLPLFFSQKITSNEILQRGLFGNEFLNILYSITTFHPFWTGGGIAAFNPQPIVFYFWIIPVFAFLGLFLQRRNKLIVFFGILSFIGIFLTKQVGQPFSYVYEFLFQHLPGFSVFREASKFYYVILLGFSILIAGFFLYVINNIKSRFIQLFLYLLFAFLILLNVKPFLLGELPLSKPFKIIPNDYVVLDNFIYSQPEFSRTLWVPAFSKWGPSDYFHPVEVAADVFSNSWKDYFKKENNLYASNGGKLIVASLKDQSAQNLLSISSIKYIILPAKDNKNDEDFFVFYGQKRGYYEKKLDSIPYFKKINIGTKDVVVYDNQSAKPHIYMTSEKETIAKTIPYEIVKSSYISQTQYSININNVSKPFYINFSETYNPNWKLKSGNFDWIKSLFDKNYFLPVSHQENDAGLNSFYIDPKQTCVIATNCTKNADGTYNMQLTLYFKPQSYLYLGLIISGITLMGIIVAVVILGIKEVKIRGRKN